MYKCTNLARFLPDAATANGTRLRRRQNTVRCVGPENHGTLLPVRWKADLIGSLSSGQERVLETTEVLMRQGRRVTAAVLVVLILGITAGRGPGQHTCASQTSHANERGCVSKALPDGLGLRVTAEPEAQHLAHDDSLCLACLLRAQFSALTISVVPQVLPPQEHTGVAAYRHVSTTNPLHLRRNARDPPQAFQESGTV